MNTNNLNIVYEDNHIIVVVKPANILSQKDYTNDLDMMTIIKQYLKEKYNKPNEAFLGLVHRLDRRVAGLMVYAKTSKGASRLSETIRNHQFNKEYLTIVIGNIPEEGTLKNYMIKATVNNHQLANIVDSNTKGAKEAVLEFKKLKSFKIEEEIYSLLKINLITGRYNQIRKQLSNFGYPIINDFKYGYNGKNYLDELGLICSKISFKHPTKDEFMEFVYYPNEGIWSYIGGYNFEE